MYSFQIFKNQYKKITNSFTSETYNTLFLYQGTIYLLNGSDIYTCDDLDGSYNWVYKKNIENSNNGLSKPCYRGKYAYCYDSSENIYRFDFENLTLSLLDY